MEIRNLGKSGLRISSQNGNTVISLGGSTVTLVGVPAAKFRQGDAILL